MERNEILSSYISKPMEEAAAGIVDAPALLNEFMKLMTELLNELEWFSMHFTYNLADEKLVYQSLHQTFTSNVQTLYFFIGRINKIPSEKYYTNIIELYGTWYGFVEKKQKKWNELQKRMLRKGQPL
jgi:hypothetical protein